MDELDVRVPAEMQLPHQALQLRVFDRATRKVIGSAVHDRTTVNYSPIDRNVRGRPTLDVVIGEPFISLETLLSITALDGLYYPVLEIPA